MTEPTVLLEAPPTMEEAAAKRREQKKISRSMDALLAERGIQEDRKIPLPQLFRHRAALMDYGESLPNGHVNKLGAKMARFEVERRIGEQGGTIEEAERWRQKKSKARAALGRLTRTRTPGVVSPAAKAKIEKISRGPQRRVA